MKKALYSIVFLLGSLSMNAQNLVFSWTGAFFATAPARDSVYFFVQNSGLQDVYLTAWGPTRLYYSNADILIAGETGGLNPSWTFTSAAIGAGFQIIGTPAHVDEVITIQGNMLDRFVGVAPFVAPGGTGLLLDGEGAQPTKLGTYRFRTAANGNMGGTGCFVVPPFHAFATYTSSLTPIYDVDLEEVLPPTGPCAGGCAISFNVQGPMPEQGSCCASCGLLAEGAVLPVSLIRFVAEKFGDRSTNLFWQTASEENVSHFEIERSVDATKWELVSKANAHGTSNSVHSYTTIDQNVYDGRSARALFYYRLKMVDNDGSFKYSGIQTVRFTTNTGVFGAYIYPNPSSDQLTVELNYADDSAPVRDLLIFNNLGQLVYSLEVADGQDVVYLNHRTTGLVAGTYTLELRDANNVPLSQDKIVVQR